MISPAQLVPELEHLAGVLTEAGVPATIDPTTIVVPGAWVTIERLEPTTLDGRFDVTATITLLVPDVGHASALTQLGWMLDTCAEVLPGISAATPEAAQLPGIEGPLPSLRFTVNLEEI